MAKYVFLSLITVLLAGTAWGAPTAQQKAEIEAVGDLMAKAGALFKEKKYAECGEVVQQVQQKVEALSATGDAVILRQLEPLYKRLKEGHARLELEGIELSPLMPLGEAKPKKPPTPEKPKTEPSPAGGGLSFVKHVAPVLVAKCGKCHVEQTKGQFSAASYASLMKGAGTDGKVIFPGDAAGSRLIEVIESGDMPRGGGKLSQLEFDLLKKWINDGAKFDGPDENAAIAKLVPTTTTAAPMPVATPSIVEATGKETVSFSKEIASVLAENCNRCHGTNNPRANFSLANFTALMKGSENGPVLTPGDGAKSLIVMKLKGTASGMRMPANARPLPDPVIAKIETWISEGAKFDGPDANATLAQLAALAKAAGATHEELSADRVKLAEQTWNTAMPGVRHDSAETANFYAKGTVGENTLKDIVDRAEQTIPKVATILGAPSDRSLVKGRFTVLVVSARYDFSEIGKVLLNTTGIPPGSTGLWRYNGIDAAGVVLLPKNESDYAVDAIIAEQAAGAYLSGAGKNVPKWFAEGVGRVVASRLAPGDPRVQEWDRSVPAAYSSLTSPAAFLDPKFDPEIGGIASYSFARFLMNDAKRFNKLLDDLRRGGKFDELFVAAYGGPPNAAAELWYRKGPSKPRPVRSAANKSAKSE